MSGKGSEEWVLSKENIPPIKQGRRTKLLKVGLAGDCTDDIGPQLHLYENELCTYSGDDPLSVWCRYIDWVDQNFPKGNREEHIKQLIERCFSTFRKEKKYFNDGRFVDIMLKYAILSGKPFDVYNYMLSNKIGFKSAKFYINWSQELEQLDNLKKADEILIYGIQCEAEPLEKLVSYYKNFQIRFSDNLKSNSGRNLLISENSRSAFVKPQKKCLSTSKPNEAMIENKNLPLVPEKCQPQPKNISSKVPFKISDSENTILPLKPQSYFPMTCDQISGNLKEKELTHKQNEVCDHCLQASNTKKQTFKLYCDEENEQKVHAPRSYPESSKLLYSCSENPPVALFEPEDPSKKSMYPKNKVYRGTKEFSLEEIRASEWLDEQKRVQQGNLLIEQQKEIKKEKDELKKKVEYLTKQVELLQSCLRKSGLHLSNFSDTDKLNTDINSLENIRSSREVKKIKTEHCRAFDNCENSTQHAYNDLKHGIKSHPPGNFHDSLNFKSLSSSVENKDPVEVGMCDTAKMVQELYNGAAFSSMIEGEHKQSLTNEFTEKCSLIVSSNFSDFKETSQKENVQRDNEKEFNHNLPFSFYHDPTSVIIDSKDPPKSLLDQEKDPLVSPNLSSEEDIENIPPKGYVQESSNRELAGILQPSKNILFIPLEEQEEMDDNSDIEENYIYGNERQYTDDTLIPPSNTEQFKAAQFISSTPYLPRNTTLEKSRLQNTSETNDAVIAHNLPAVESPNMRTKECDQEDSIKTELKYAREQNSLLRQSRMLSVIMETSAETYSKSSSSSSGSLTRSNNLEQILSNRASMLKHFSKIETCEPSAQNSISDASQGISETNCQNVSEMTHKFADMDQKVQLHTVDFDPFDHEINQKFLNNLNKDYKNLYCINKSLKGLKEGVNVSIGPDSYRIIFLVAEGAYAKVYKAVKCASVTDTNKKFALKVCKNSDEWEFYICDELQKRLLEKNMPDIRNSFMSVISAEKFLNGLILVSDFSSLGTLLDVVNFYKKQNLAIPEFIIMYFTLEILLIVSKLHECNIIHGDIKPDNFLLMHNTFDPNHTKKLCEVKTLQLIDFGRAIDLNFYDKGTCFTSVLKKDYFKCTEMKDNKPWVFQLDWYCVASCIHTMLFSDYMTLKKENNVWKIVKKLRRYWCTSLWDSLFNKLLNIPECYQEPDIHSDICAIQSKLQQNSASFFNHLDRFVRSKTEK